MYSFCCCYCVFCFKQKTAYEVRISDWSSDVCSSDLIIPIVDLCHFGVPDWIGNFQNEDFGRLFAGYAADFADRYPWVQLYTPVNEMFICATFSAKYGWWNEQMTTDRSFVMALKNTIGRAHV